MSPGWIVKFAGGEKGVRDKIVARLPIPKEKAIVPPTAKAPEGKRIANEVKVERTTIDREPDPPLYHLL